MRNLTKLLMVFALGLVTSQAFAQKSVYRADGRITNVNKAGDIGVGIMVGLPTGLNVKTWLSDDRAFNGNIAYSSGDLAIMGDHLWHFRRAFSSATYDRLPSTLSPYIGVGGVVVFNTASANTNEDRPLYRRSADGSTVGLGARIPVGLEFLPQNVPMGIFAELAPGTIVFPAQFAFLQADVGARYYF